MSTPPPTPSVRDATAGDAAPLARLLGQLGYPAACDEVTGRLAAAAGAGAGAGDHGGVVVAVRDGIVVGFASYQLVEFFEDGAPRCRITALAVDESARRQGTGRALVTEVERRARARGCTEIEVSSARRAGRAAAHRFYPGVGYTDANLTSAYYRRPLDEPPG